MYPSEHKEIVKTKHINFSCNRITRFSILDDPKMWKKLKDVIILICFLMILHILNDYENVKGERYRAELLKYSHNIYVPKIFPEKKMKFNLYTNKDTLGKNKYGIFEVDNKKYLEPNLFDLMLIPFVGVDINGYRIGYGGGYFDRALSCINKIKTKPIIIGLGYDYQIISKALAEPHDLKYQKVFTETKILSYN